MSIEIKIDTSYRQRKIAEEIVMNEPYTVLLTLSDNYNTFDVLNVDYKNDIDELISEGKESSLVRLIDLIDSVDWSTLSFSDEKRYLNGTIQLECVVAYNPFIHCLKLHILFRNEKDMEDFFNNPSVHLEKIKNFFYDTSNYIKDKLSVYIQENKQKNRKTESKNEKSNKEK